LNDRLKSANEEITQYKTQFDQCKAQLDQYKAQLNQCKEDIVKMSSDKEKALKDISILNVKLTDANNEIAAIKRRNAVSCRHALVYSLPNNHAVW